MNRYLNKLIMYHEIHKLDRQGHSINYIADFLGINWRTVKKYLMMDERSYEEYAFNNNRPKELAPYEHFVKSRLDVYPDTSAAQIHDWLKETYSNFPQVHPKTVYNFVMWVRQEYNIPKTKPDRDFFIVEELPFGQQAQVDFGEYNMRSSNGKKKKVYFFSMLLSRSRQKFIFFTDSPFTSTKAVLAHEKAFAYFQGIPQEIVYDQDAVFMHDENAGDLLLTEVFKLYIQQRKFNTYFCRSADPQTKGKVENVVKYVKQNFLYNRSYYDVETLNDEAIAWLNRTANYIPHGKTKLPPVEQWRLEKEYLSHFAPLELDFNQRKIYTVRKDNVLVYKSNFYSLPQGTWQKKGTQVYVIDKKDSIVVKDFSGNTILQTQLCQEKGKTIINNNHKRDKSSKIDQLIQDVSVLFNEPQEADKYFEMLRKEKPRYIRDQIQIIKKCFQLFSSTATNQALSFCLENNIYSAADFKDVAEKMQQNQAQSCKTKTMEAKQISIRSSFFPDVVPNASKLIDYEILMSNKN